MGGVDPASLLSINFLRGVLLLALGAFVASVRPRRRANGAFAVFSGATGLVFVLVNLEVSDVGLRECSRGRAGP